MEGRIKAIENHVEMIVEFIEKNHASRSDKVIAYKIILSNLRVSWHWKRNDYVKLIEKKNSISAGRCEHDICGYGDTPVESIKR